MSCSSSCQKPDQIFSLKSNLITQFKGTSMNLNQNKNSQHARLKSFCFSNVLKTIRNDVGRFRMREQDRDQIREGVRDGVRERDTGESKEREKENRGMIIQACNFRGVYGQDVMGIQPSTKPGILHSRSFLIRSFHNKRVDSIGSQTKQAESVPKQPQHCTTFHLNPRYYKLQSLRQLKQNITIRPKKNYHSSQPPSLSILIPIQLTRNINKSNFETLAKQLAHKNIDIFLIAQQHQVQKPSKQQQQLQQYCHTLIVHPSSSPKKPQPFHGNSQTILNFPSEILQQTGTTLLILFNPTSTTQSPKTNLYLPFCNKYTSSTDYEQHNSMEVRLCYLNATLGNIVSVQVEGKGDGDGEDGEGEDGGRIAVGMCWNQKRKGRIVEEVYTLGEEVRLRLEAIERDRNQARVQEENTTQLQLTTVQQLQQNLLQHSKTLKKQPLPVPVPVPIPNPTSLPLPNPQQKQKQSRRSLTTKSWYQQIYQLVKNNTNICKQINKYVENCRGLQMQEIFVDCDDIFYYLVL